MPEIKDTPLDQLQTFLNKLFQFESQDLDFGVYKILHYKSKEIKQFITELLVDKVKEQLLTLTEAQIAEAKEKTKELEQDDIIAGWLKADDTERKTLEKYGKEIISQYRQYKNIIQNAQVSVETENQIYNHLTLFFSRYYDKGDFISKRRFGKNGKYVIPYNGEEAYFYWANYDQYYIKSSETFQQFAFKIPQSAGDLVVHFKLTDAVTEQGNVKADENKYFILSEKEPELADEILNIFFEYRPLHDQEKKSISGNNKQDTLNEQATDTLYKKLGKKVITAKLWEKKKTGKTDEKEAQTLLLRKLHQYTRKNTYDFFIHKNLKGFLQRELDFYIKDELIAVDDLYVSEAAEHFDRLRQNLKKIKVFKSIADTLIDFLAQIEAFQKKLWEKKKFVLNTEWVITIDRLIKYAGEEKAKPVLEEVIKNKKQREEWTDLFGKENVPAGKLTLDHLKADPHTWRKLPIDTVHFSKAFKENLLNVLSKKIDLEHEADGLLIHSDNFHGISILQNKFNEAIKCIHIDPPYNTSTSGFLYKNEYKHASWLSMMNDRINLSIDLMSAEASFQCHIDENEYENLEYLFWKYPLYKAGPLIWDKRNPMNGGSGIANQHEYIIWQTKNNSILYLRNKSTLNMLEKANELIQQAGGEVTESVRKKFLNWINKNKELSGGEKAYRYLDDNGKIYQSVSLRAPEPRTDEKFFIPLIHPNTGRPCPVPPNGFSRTPETLSSMIARGEIIFGTDETTQPRQKAYLTTESKRQFNSIIQNGKKGKSDTAPLKLNFPYCHPTSLYIELIGASSLNNGDYTFDYFAGSGTTFHATQLLNKEDEGKRKCILVEQGNYVYTVIIPRIKKIAYTFDWKDGQPKDGSMNGLGVFFKYQRLEQYEEALENIAFSASEETIQQAIKFDQYIPKYFLEFETRDSQTLVNTEVMLDPWNYKLKVWDGFTYDHEQPADLVETFNYLIGLHMQKCMTKTINDNKYMFVSGKDNTEKQLLVIWRNTKDWKVTDYEADSKALKEDLKKYQYDLLYINGQANIEGYQPVEEIFKNKMMG